MNKKQYVILIAVMFMLPSFAFACNIEGTLGNDSLHGTNLDETICGYAGNDYIDGNGGNDILLGGWGADTIFGGDGDDTIDGGAGIFDVCYGNGGTDLIRNCETYIADQASASDLMIVEVSETTEKIIGGKGTTVIVFPKGAEAAKASANAIDEGALMNPLSGKKIVLENTDNIVIE